MSNITFIFPLFNLSENDRLTKLNRAVASVEGQGKVLFVGKREDLDLVTAGGTKVVNDTDNLTYPAQVMLGVKAVDTEYFSVVEQDDVVSDKWAGCVEQYISSFNDDVFGYLPLTEVIDDKTNETISYANEAFWASSFSEELGFLDLNAIQDYLNFNTSGGVFKTKEFLSLGGLKTSMKLVFWYEFLMRALYKQKKIFVTPRVGYFHYSDVEGCLTDQYANTMDEKEVDWWVELAKKEYYFPQDRNKTYEEE
jgi:hypothetical protein